MPLIVAGDLLSGQQQREARETFGGDRVWSRLGKQAGTYKTIQKPLKLHSFRNVPKKT